MALSKVSEDAPKEKRKRVAAARERRLGTQRRQIERRRIRRDKRYRKTPGYKAFQTVLNFDSTKFQAAVSALADRLANLSRDIKPAKSRRGMSPTFVTVDEIAFGSETYFEEQKPRMMYSELERTTRLAETAALTVKNPELKLKFTAQ